MQQEANQLVQERQKISGGIETLEQLHSFKREEYVARLKSKAERELGDQSN